MIVYCLLYLSPVLTYNYPAAPYFIQVFRITVLYSFVLIVKYFTLSLLPDLNHPKDALRKLFVSVNFYHGLMAVNAFIYPFLYMDYMISLGCSREISPYGTLLPVVIGLVAFLAYLVRFSFIVVCFDKPYNRIH